MIPRRTSLRSTLDALSQALVDAVLLAVRRTSPTELADVLDVAPSRAPFSSAPARSQRPRRAPPAAPRQASRQLELPLDPPNAYPEATIVDPDAVLGALDPRQKTASSRRAPKRATRRHQVANMVARL